MAAKTAKYKALARINHDGETFFTGSELTLTKEQAAPLFNRGLIEDAQGNKVEFNSGLAQVGQLPHDPFYEFNVTQEETPVTPPSGEQVDPNAGNTPNV